MNDTGNSVFPPVCYTTSIGRAVGKKVHAKRKSMTEQHLPLTGKIALVTGSSQGIGRATALRLAQSGSDIVINYRNKASAAEEVKANIEEMGRRCIAIQADVSQEEDVTRLFTVANESLGPITILVNNAGTTRYKLILQMSLPAF